MRYKLGVKQLLVVCLVFSISACAASPANDYYYNEIMIRNNFSEKVTNVTISVEKTYAVFSCSYIPPGSECSNKFRKRKYLGNPIQNTWAYHDRKKATDEFFLKLPPGLRAISLFRGILEVIKGGMINPYIDVDKNK